MFDVCHISPISPIGPNPCDAEARPTAPRVALPWVLNPSSAKIPWHLFSDRFKCIH
jgi:hypothetical protein